MSIDMSYEQFKTCLNHYHMKNGSIILTKKDLFYNAESPSHLYGVIVLNEHPSSYLDSKVVFQDGNWESLTSFFRSQTVLAPLFKKTRLSPASNQIFCVVNTIGGFENAKRIIEEEKDYSKIVYSLSEYDFFESYYYARKEEESIKK